MLRKFLAFIFPEQKLKEKVVLTPLQRKLIMLESKKRRELNKQK